MRAMNGLTHSEVSRLMQQLEKEECDVRNLLLEEFSHRASGQNGATGYREGTDFGVVADASIDHAPPLILGCVATRNAIEKSLDAIRAGTYGACQECGHYIGLKRLQSQPTAILCIHCADKHAQTPKQRRR
ncbi:MAG: TraR/DksA family transcriptional regulator [Betaproteobacteria bacterium]|nr:TraR/DksA family transcriptional regulator [Betaproteobacteria bacterium]